MSPGLFVRILWSSSGWLWSLVGLVEHMYLYRIVWVNEKLLSVVTE
jgi:hypothetical protein